MLPLNILLWVICLALSILALFAVTVVILAVSTGIAQAKRRDKELKLLGVRRNHPAYGGLKAVPKDIDCE